MDAAATGYGADEAGLICGFLFRPGGTTAALNAAEAAAWLAARSSAEPDASGPGEGQAFIWLHFNLGHDAAERWLRQHARLPETFFDTLKDGMHSTPVERAEESLVAVVVSFTAIAGRLALRKQRER